MKLLWHLNSKQSAPGKRLACVPALSRASGGEGEILNFDILVCERDWQQTIAAFESLDLSKYRAVRVQDVGVFHYLLKNTELDLHLNLETGNHNLEGLKKWCELGKGRVKRVVLSHEIPAQKLKTYIAEIKKYNIETELLISGPILLFYSPRSLLTASFGEKTEFAIADSYESPHSGFRIEENQHGTFKYHLKDLFLWDRLAELRELGLDWGRVDVSRYDQALVDLVVAGEFEKLKETYPVGTTRGYFDTNKTDVLFPKLKNEHLRRVDTGFVGSVVEANRGHYLAVELKSGRQIASEQTLSFISPEGKESQVQVNVLERLSEDLVLINYAAKIPVRSAVYQS